MLVCTTHTDRSNPASPPSSPLPLLPTNITIVFMSIPFAL